MSRKKSTAAKKPDTPETIDPYIEREKQKYQKPIPSREYILSHLTHEKKPITLSQIADLLNLSSEEDLEALRRRVRAMERDGQLIRNRRKGYGIAAKMDLVRGRLIAHPDGFGFLVRDEGGEDIYLSAKQMRSLMHKDRVLVNIVGVDFKGRPEGTVVEVLERANHRVVGQFFKKKGITFIEPDNPRLSQRIIVDGEQLYGAKHGQIVVVEIDEYPTKYDPAVGRITEIMGDQRDPGLEIDIAIRSHEIPHHWPVEVEQEATHFKPTVPENLYKNREDLREMPFVTIDGEDARDFDDAVYCEPRGRGWLLKVAIADVSTYVKPSSALDIEAKNRGNSVYFPEQVVPMLPEALSNGLCSLQPNVDRLCLICEMSIDMFGRNRRTRFYEAVICSSARLTYNQVAKVLDGDSSDFPNPEVLPHVKHLNKLYRLLQNRRKKRGAIDFETVETRIIFDEQRKIDKIIPVIRNDAHKLIEEMMLAANVATAEWLDKHEIPFLYRIHEPPTEERLKDVRLFLGKLGLSFPAKGTPEVKHFARLLDKISKRPDLRLIQTVLLRSMKLAIYSTENKGHFGLSFDSYTHFTSPIRRYPDLMVHRAIKHCLQGRSAKKFLYSENEMQLLGEQCSMTERRADEATREVVSWLKCEYMQNKVGEDYEGIVTAVTPFGIFVELDDLFVEGLVHVTALGDDYFHYDPIGQRMLGEASGVCYRLSDRLKVKVVRVNLDDKKIDFELA
ncbi:MAG: ribonuclease R [Thiotrichaceae bacterium]|nr:ribonuclease R [Thiotrichaceae bacterium]